MASDRAKVLCGDRESVEMPLSHAVQMRRDLKRVKMECSILVRSEDEGGWRPVREFHPDPDAPYNGYPATGVWVDELENE